mmetsp:Transcript_13188/g.46134  ORF Transcript_13188/g.46134 Transcript_13188/m.46134 type:complete len:319 (+) Transcript_13188:4517-5473(+)
MAGGAAATAAAVAAARAEAAAAAARADRAAAALDEFVKEPGGAWCAGRSRPADTGRCAAADVGRRAVAGFATFTTRVDAIVAAGAVPDKAASPLTLPVPLRRRTRTAVDARPTGIGCGWSSIRGDGSSARPATLEWISFDPGMECFTSRRWRARRARSDCDVAENAPGRPLLSANGRKPPAPSAESFDAGGDSSPAPASLLASLFLPRRRRDALTSLSDASLSSVLSPRANARLPPRISAALRLLPRRFVLVGVGPKMSDDVVLVSVTSVTDAGVTSPFRCRRLERAPRRDSRGDLRDGLSSMRAFGRDAALDCTIAA